MDAAGGRCWLLRRLLLLVEPWWERLELLEWVKEARDVRRVGVGGRLWDWFRNWLCGGSSKLKKDEGTGDPE